MSDIDVIASIIVFLMLSQDISVLASFWPAELKNFGGGYSMV